MDATNYRDGGARHGPGADTGAHSHGIKKTSPHHGNPVRRHHGNPDRYHRFRREKGKIKIARIEDNTAQHVDILVHLPAGVDPSRPKRRYSPSPREVSVSPNACVIVEDKPRFMRISDILRYNTDATKETLRQEQEIRLQELNAAWHQASLEKIFIENRIYLTIEDCETWEEVLETIDRELQPFARKLRSPITRDDLIRLTEIKIKRISNRRLQGRSAHSAVGGGHRPDAEKPQPAHQIHHPLV